MYADSSLDKTSRRLLGCAPILDDIVDIVSLGFQLRFGVVSVACCILRLQSWKSLCR